jgi:hypothetical protein
MAFTLIFERKENRQVSQWNHLLNTKFTPKRLRNLSRRPAADRPLKNRYSSESFQVR